MKHNITTITRIRTVKDKMLQEGLDPIWIKEISQYAEDWEGLLDLMWMWYEETDKKEKLETIKAIEESLKDIKQEE